MLSVLLSAVGHCVGYDSFVDLVRAELAGRLEPSRDDIVSAIDSLMRHDILTLVSVEEEAATVLPEVRRSRGPHTHDGRDKGDGLDPSLTPTLLDK